MSTPEEVEEPIPDEEPLPNEEPVQAEEPRQDTNGPVGIDQPARESKQPNANSLEKVDKADRSSSDSQNSDIANGTIVAVLILIFVGIMCFAKLRR